MKKFFVILMALALVASFAVTAFATEAGNDIPSPTDVPQVIVDFDSQHPGATEDVFEQAYDKGSTVTFVAPESEYEFLGFKVEGEDYEVVSGAQYIIDGAATRTAERPTLVLKVNADVKVTALYDIDADEEPTTETQPDDEDGDSPQTGDSTLVYCIVGALIVGVAGLAFAGTKLLKKEN